MTTPITDADLERLEELAGKATPGPWDTLHGDGPVRAIRGDWAIPLFDVRAPSDDPEMPAPTVRVGSEVIARADSTKARSLAAFKQAHRNAAYLAAANPSAIRALITRLRESDALLRHLRNQLDSMLAEDGDRYLPIYPDPDYEVEKIDAYFAAFTKDPDSE